jgi:hypothetical protein
MSYLVTIELDFDNHPTQEDVHNYLIELMDDGGVAYNLHHFKWDEANWEGIVKTDLGLHLGGK